MSEEKKEIKAIINGTLIDCTGREPIEDSVVLMENSKISLVGSRGEVKIPAEAKVFDVKGRTIMPGMIDLHVHMAWPWGAFDEYQLTLLAARNLRQSLERGITTVRDVGAPLKIAHAVKWAQARGILGGSKAYISGPILCMTGGHGSMFAGMRECDGPWDCRKAVRENIKGGVDLIKICTTHRPWQGVEEFTIEELKAIVDEAHKAKKRVAAHAALMPGMEQAIKAGVDTIEHGPSEFPREIDNETVGLMVESGIILVPTLWIFLHKLMPEEERQRKQRLKAIPLKQREETEKWRNELQKYAPINFKKCVDAGVKVATGTDTSGTKPGGRYEEPFAVAYEEMILMANYGLPPIEALKAGTLNAAEALGLENEFGTIEEGKLANIVVVDGDPLNDMTCLRKVLFVMEGGVVHKNLLGKI